MSNQNKRGGGGKNDGPDWDFAIDEWEKKAFSDVNFDENAMASPTKEPPPASEAPKVPPIAAARPVKPELPRASHDDEATSIALDLEDLRIDLAKRKDETGAADENEAPLSEDASQRPTPIPDRPLDELLGELRVASLPPPPALVELAAERVSMDPEDAAIDVLLAAEAPISAVPLPSERSLGAMFPVGSADNSVEIAAIDPAGLAVDELERTQFDAPAVPPSSAPTPLGDDAATPGATAAANAEAELAYRERSPSESQVFWGPTSSTDGLSLPSDEESAFPPEVDALSAPLDLDDVAETQAIDRDALRAPSAPAPEVVPAAADDVDDEAATQAIAAVSVGDEAPAIEAAEPPSVPAKAASIAPPPVAVAVPSAAAFERSFEGEQPAADRLSADRCVEFIERAEWLAEEARLLEDGAAKARGLLAASELSAIAGDTARAEVLAIEAEEAAPKLEMVRHQVRAFAAALDDDTRVRELLEIDSREASTAEARAHAHFTLLRTQRHRGELDASIAAELGKRYPHDVRAALTVLDLALDGDTAALGVLKSGPLAGATDSLRALHGQATSDEPTLENTWRRALTASARVGEAQAGETLARLEALAAALPPLENATLWLRAALGREHAGTRLAAAEALRRLPGRPGRDRLLAATLLELGDGAALRELSGSAVGFSGAERAALSALAGGEVDYDGEDALGAALGACARLKGSDDDQARRVAGEASGHTAQRAARRIARGLPLAALDDELLGAELRGTERAAAVVRLREAGKLERVAEQLLADAGLAETVAAALLAEAAAQPERAHGSWSTVLRRHPEVLVAARARHEIDAAKGNASPADLAQALLTAIEASSPTLRATLALELLARDERAEEKLTDAHRDELLRKLQSDDPQSALATFLGEELAARQGDRAERLRWIGERRGLELGAEEGVLETVRELLLLVDEDPELALGKAEDAHRAQPKDLALRELYEGLSPEPLHDDASYRAARAAELEGAPRKALLLEAAFRLERDGKPAEALALLRSEVDAAPQSSLFAATVERLELGTGEAARLTDQLMDVVRNGEDRARRLQAYARLAQLDAEGRKDAASAVLWHRSILEEDAHNLASLRYMEHALISGGRDEELEPWLTSIAQILASDHRDANHTDTAGEASAHAELAARLRVRGNNGVWTQARDLVELAFQQPKPSLWAVRTLNAHARHAKDDGAWLSSTQRLLERTEEPADRAPLLVRAAEAAARLGRAEEARAKLEEAVVADPGDVVAWGLLVEAREATGDIAGAAEACESVARSSSVEAHRLVAWYNAAEIWLDELDTRDRGVLALENAAAINPAYHRVFERLSELYAADGKTSELAELIERRLADITDEDERVALEVELARTLQRLGELAQAKATLDRALGARPEDPRALSVFAEVCAADDDWAAAEDAWLRLARLLTTPAEQRQVYQRLGELYTHHAINYARAEAAWREVQKRAPGEQQPLLELVSVYRAQNDTARAVETFEQVLKLAPDSDTRQKRLVELAALHESSHNARKAEQVLEAARKEFPTSVVPLRALGELYQRQKQGPALNILLDRAAGDARRAIAAGRVTAAVFQTLGAAAELRGNKDAARVVEATVAAFEGRTADLDGATLRATDPRLDDLLAPEVLSPALRALLGRTGDALDQAMPLDLRSLDAVAVNPQQAPLAQMIVQAATQLGIHGLQVLSSNRLGRVCLPVSSSPPVVLVGEPLLSVQHDKARAFLVVRALKLLYMRASALVRTSAQDLPVLVGAWVKAFNPSWVAPGLNAAKVAEMGQRLSGALASVHQDPNLGVMALEAAAALGTQTANLGSSTLTWANRAALLAVGDPSAALDAVAWSLGQEGLPVEREARAAWIARTQDARELLAFSVSDPYLEARRRLGLGG